MQNHSYENDFDLHENETACRTRCHMKGFALRLVLKQRHKRTRKWPIIFLTIFNFDFVNSAFGPMGKGVLEMPYYYYLLILLLLFFSIYQEIPEIPVGL